MTHFFCPFQTSNLYFTPVYLAFLYMCILVVATNHIKKLLSVPTFGNKTCSLNLGPEGKLPQISKNMDITPNVQCLVWTLLKTAVHAGISTGYVTALPGTWLWHHWCAPCLSSWVSYSQPGSGPVPGGSETGIQLGPICSMSSGSGEQLKRDLGSPQKGGGDS